MLASDPETLTFSLPAAGEQAEHLLTIMPLPAVMNQVVGRRRPPDDPQTQELPRT